MLFACILFFRQCSGSFCPLSLYTTLPACTAAAGSPGWPVPRVLVGAPYHRHIRQLGTRNAACFGGRYGRAGWTNDKNFVAVCQQVHQRERESTKCESGAHLSRLHSRYGALACRPGARSGRQVRPSARRRSGPCTSSWTSTKRRAAQTTS